MKGFISNFQQEIDGFSYKCSLPYQKTLKDKLLSYIYNLGFKRLSLFLWDPTHPSYYARIDKAREKLLKLEQTT